MAKSNESHEQGTPPTEVTTAFEHTTISQKSCNKIPVALACLAFALAGYSCFGLYQAHQDLSLQKQSLHALIQQTAQQQTAAMQKNNIQLTQLQQQNTQRDEQINALSMAVERIKNQKTSQPQDWLLLKARHYIELAQINAHWGTHFNDGSTALLLEQADLILAQINSPRLFKIRQIIAQELLQARQTPQVDIPGILSKLDALQQQIAQWNMYTLSSIAEQQTTPDKTPQQPNVWKNHLQASLNWLQQLVIIRHHDHSIQPLLSPALESMIKESIRLNLQEAQWAVINANSTAYQLGLKQAIKTIQDYGHEQQLNTAVWVQQLNVLLAINITPKQPLIGQALPLLNQLVEPQPSDVVAAPTAEKGE